MATEPKAIEQDYVYQVDQQVSVNAFIDIEVDGENVRFQITSRYGATTEKILKTTSHAIEAYQMLRQSFPRTLIAPPAPQEPRYQPIDDGGNDKPAVESFIADKLDVSMNNGKIYFKVKGGKFSQYGVTVWDEVLKASGIQIDMNNPTNVPSIGGWKAEYIEQFKDGKTIRKVTKLSPI